jgi:uncharacterized repeat protein (TIGR03803 family)
MKKITSVLILSFFLAAGINFSSAQNHVIFGTCSQGGASNGGTIFQADVDGSNLHAVHSFVMAEGLWPWGRNVQAPNGKIYGVTFLGGCSDSCTLYEYDPITTMCTDVYDFYCNTPMGEPSQGGVILLPDGNIYGHQQNGIIYKFDPNTHVYTMLNSSSGYYMGGLMQGADGALYGVSYSGGANSQGYIFRYDLTTQTYTILYSFDGIHGAAPYIENLLQGTDGKLYGTTYAGGANSTGVIFSYDIAANVYADLHDFNGTQGSTPYSGLVQASNGKLYGMTNVGGTNNYGVIFSYDIAASQYSVIHNFSLNDGTNPQRTLTQASNGLLFGTTISGGIYGLGTAFKFDVATNTYTKIFDFDSNSGTQPQSDIQEAVVSIETGITSAGSASPSIYVDASSQHLIIQNLQPNSSAQLIVYDAVGKNIFQSDINNQKSEFDFSAYPGGIYLVQLKTDGKIDTQKIILSK